MKLQQVDEVRFKKEKIDQRMESQGQGNKQERGVR
jgi:hypothetical protein